MSFARNSISVLALLLLFTAAAICPAAAQAPSSSSNVTAVLALSPQSTQTYTLPPDKLAKAIALSRIRNILDITGSVWDVVFLWLPYWLRAAAL